MQRHPRPRPTPAVKSIRQGIAAARARPSRIIAPTAGGTGTMSLTSAAPYVLVPFMSAAPTPAEQPKPSRAGRLLDLVRRLIDYGKELATTLHQRAATDPRSVARSFGTCDLALILVRITRGLLRAHALEERLVQSAARLDAGRRARSAPAQRKPRPTNPAMPRTEDPDAPLALPTEAEIAAWVRRRPIGAVVADICRDLGIACSHPLWRELQRAIITEGGSYARLVVDIIDRVTRLIADAWPASALTAPPVPASTGPP